MYVKIQVPSPMFYFCLFFITMSCLSEEECDGMLYITKGFSCFFVGLFCFKDYGSNLTICQIVLKIIGIKGRRH